MPDNHPAVATLLVLLIAGVAPALTFAATGTSLTGTDPLLDTATDGNDPTPHLLTEGPRVEPYLVERLRQVPEVPVLLHFHDMAARDAALPLTPEAVPFSVLPVLSTRTTSSTFDTLLGLPGLVMVERADKPLRFALESARDASNATQVIGDPANDIPPLLDHDGHPLDGRGVGVAIVDTGIDPTHPDVAPRLGGSWIVNDLGVIAAPDPDPVSAHGTLVAGVVAGTGGTDLPNHGVAPNATLYSFDIGVGATNLHAAHAFEWIHQHGAELDPPIRIVVNAWGCTSGPCRVWDPAQAHQHLVSSLAENGTVMLFAAGNEGGGGLVSTVNAEANNPTPGVIGVGAYDDEDIGTRLACVSYSSSMGALEEPATWPDLIAPGDWTWTTNAVHVDEDGRIPGIERKSYRHLHGTSAATAHVGGIVALMLQAEPELHPADVEYALKATAEKIDCGLAYVRADATHPWGGAHPRMGHGLVDAKGAAGLALEGFSIPQDEPELEPVPAEWLDGRMGTDVRYVWYLTREDGISSSYPQGPLPDARLVRQGEPAVFTSEPLGSAVNVSAARVDVWWGTFAECVCLRVTAPRFVTTLERVHENGTAEILDRSHLSTWYVHTALPVQRPIDLSFPETTLGATDRLRLTVAADPKLSVPLVTSEFLLYVDAPDTASRIALGDAARADHGGAVWCQVRQDCADVGGERRIEGLHCADAPMRVEWTGPGGSGIVLSCSGATVTCRVPSDLAEGSCSSESLLNPTQVGEKTATCRYISTDDLLLPGSGRCYGLLLRQSGD